MVPGVADLWGRNTIEARAKGLVSPEQLRAQLSMLREQRAVVVLLVDLLDASGSFLSRVRDLVGKNPVFLIGTKVCTPSFKCPLKALPSSWAQVDLGPILCNGSLLTEFAMVLRALHC